MIIDFDKVPEEHIEGFKGGEGRMDVRAFVDDNARLMYATLRPGACSGKHLHGENFEAMFVVSGELTVHYDDNTEVCRVGQLHYCDKGHSHWFENKTDHDCVYLAIVPIKLG